VTSTAEAPAALPVGVLDDGYELTPGECWMATRVSLKGSRSIAAMAERSDRSIERVREVAEGLARRGLVEIDGDVVTSTEACDAVAEDLRERERTRLREYVAQWPGGDEPELDALVEQIARGLLSDPSDAVPAR